MSIQDQPDTFADPLIFPLDTTNLARRSINGAAITVAAQVLKTFLTGISAVGLARLLPASDFGLLAIVAPVTGLLSLLSNIGLFQAIVQHQELTRDQVTSMFWISFLLGCATTTILIGLAPVISWIYHDSRLFYIVLAFSSTILISSVASLQIAILNRLMFFHYIAFIETVTLLVSTTISIGLAWIGCGYWALVISQIAGSVLGASLSWSMSPWEPSAFLISANVKSMLNFGKNLTVSNIAGYLNVSFDNMLIGYVLGENALGVYDRAWKLAVMPLSQLTLPINRIAVPTLSRLVNDPLRYRNAFTKMVEFLLLICGPGLAAATFSASVTVPGLLGDRWHTMIPVFQWLCIGGVISPLNGATFWLFISQGRSQDQLTFSVAAISINLMAYVIGLHWGVEGVARTSAVSVYLLQTPILLYGACRTGPVEVKDIFGALTIPTVCILGTGLTSYFAWRSWHPNSIIGIAAYFTLSYVICFLILMVLPHGRDIIYQGWSIITGLLKTSTRRL